MRPNGSSDRPQPTRLGHTNVLEEHGKVVFRETYEQPLGNVSNFLLFGATNVPVIVFPMTTDEKVIALRHFRYGAADWVVELPGGNIEGRQTPQQTVVKELAEEAGYEVAEQQVEALFDESAQKPGIWYDPASVRVRFLPFLARACQKKAGGAKPESTEHIVHETFALNQWYRMLRNGEVQDSKSIAVSLLAIPRLNGRGDLRKAALGALAPENYS